MLKWLLKSLIPVRFRRLYYAAKYKRQQAEKDAGSDKDITNTFTDIYRSNHWGSSESISGVGSELEQTIKIRRGLRQVIDRYGITSMLDIPCGDFNWMRHTDLSGVGYTGADIVAELVAKNEAAYGREGRYRFRQLDLTIDDLPQADLIFTRDCLPHLSYENIGRAIKNIKASGAKYLLTTSFPDTIRNFDIKTGDFRAINLRKPPFYFPKPLLMLEEDHIGLQTDYPDKSMLLWEVASLPDELKRD